MLRQLFRRTLPNLLRDLIRPTPLYRPLATRYREWSYRPAAEARRLAEWEASDRSGMPPHSVKKQVIREARERTGCRVFVETGTYLGLMVRALRKDFERIYTIELDAYLAARARRLLRAHPHIELLEGDSGELLSEVLSGLDVPAVFWLDAHASGGMTATGPEISPVLTELSSILQHRVRNHVILIDDARCFTEGTGYPTLETTREHVQRLRPDVSFDVRDDIIRIEPAVPE